MSISEDPSGCTNACRHWPAKGRISLAGFYLHDNRRGINRVWGPMIPYYEPETNPDGGIGSTSYRRYCQGEMGPMMAGLERAGVRSCEGESGTILTVSSLFGLKAGCICTVSDRTPWPDPSAESLDLDRNMADCINMATGAMLTMARATT